MCHQSRAPVPTSEVILARLRVAPTRPPRAPSTARDATIFPPPHPPLHARLARSRASTTVPSRAADHPAHLARSSTLARASNHPSSSSSPSRDDDDDDERDERDARTHASAPRPPPSLARIASHRTRRTHDAARASDEMHAPPTARRSSSGRTSGRGAGIEGRDSRRVTIGHDRARARDSIGRSSDRAIDDRGRQNRIIDTYIHREIRCVWDACS